MLRHPGYTRDRLAQLGERLRAAIYPEVRAVERLEVSPATGRIPYAEAQGLPYRPARIGEQLGPLWSTFWFRASTTVPEAWAGQRVDLLWISHSEATLWMDGRTLQGLNHDPLIQATSSRQDALLLARARGGERVDFRIEMACNGPFGDVHNENEGGRVLFRSLSPYVLDRCDIARFDPEAWDLYFDFLVLSELEAQEDLEPAWAGRLLAELDRFANELVLEDRATWAPGAPARRILAALQAQRNASYVHEVSAIGHAHIDTAWLWPLAETVRKCERTFSSQLAYMDRYPEHRFACSQAQHYAWIRERNPELWGRIRERVAEGRFVPVGGTWVEPDCNLPSGESLVRQFLYGQRFFERELGARCRELWQPDVFGYNGQLPQLMRRSGITRFLTQKLSWNRFNRPAHHTFTWQGIDGSEVLAHFPPVDTYNAMADVAELRRGARAYKDHDRSQNSYLLFGFGDGGGGPTPRMLEVLRRAGDQQGLPRTAIRSSDEFFTRLEADCTDRPVLIGELYFEYHRGTYTSQAANKLGNRACEQLLHDVELLWAWASRREGADYPQSDLERLWKVVLTNQFHDILPGSSIALVYEDAARDHAAVLAEGHALLDRALATLGHEEAPLQPVSTVAFPRAEVAEAPDGQLVWIEAAPCAAGAVRSTEEHVTVTALDGGFVLENRHLRAALDAGGAITSLIEKGSGREALRGPANVLELYEDRPTKFDAWDIDPFHLETRTVVPPASSAEVVRESPLRAGVLFERPLGKASHARQLVRLAAGARRLEVVSEIDWQERHVLLKAAFPVQVRAMNATYEMQFGHVERPTHYNTSHDLARYEVPAHRWIDLSEHGFGVALLSDCKYGFSTYGDTMRISLLRGPTYPDPGADLGTHRFTYALVPHAGGWREAGVVAEAARFTSPVRWGRLPASPSLAHVDDANLVLDGIKRAEDDRALILRLYEAHGARGQARLHVHPRPERAAACNLLEDEETPLPIDDDGAILLAYEPFQILTVKVT